ncbi:acyl-CoA dehydrogenase family protein [Chachezhania sediminis]|uniref:acyl-CoA dehydrogenase family protein n=1 Tax=Chachezhania sediminis TaxID=2599291 RepID=UPI00131D05F0|nr:acyl-CoA dehydrogenase family protein [Chachezhania sediminis]
MDFEFTEDQRALRDLTRRFVEKEMAKDTIAAWDRDNELPMALLDKMAEIGLMGATIPEEYGGSGGGVMEETIVLEELARHSSTVALAYGLDVSFGAVTIERHGTAEQKREFLPGLATGRHHFALSLTEPDGGTDILGAMKTVAKPDGDDFVITGSKVFTTGLNIASWLFVVARTGHDPDKPSRGLTVFLVHKDTPGISYRKIEKLGSRFLHSYEVRYDAVRVPKSSIVGEEGRGWHAILDTLNNERIFIAATCVGLAQGAFEDANQYAKERRAFDRPIGQFQAIQSMLADSLTEIELSRLMTYKAAWMQDRGQDCALPAAMAKYYASETAFRTTDRGMRVLAGYGFTMDYHMQRYYRDIRQLIFAPLTNEMNRNFIAQVGCGLPKSY